MLSSTTSVIVCDVDLNLDGQEFAALRSEQRDPRFPAVPSTATRSGLHNDVQHGIDQRHPVRQLSADAAATRGGGHRGAHSARHALGARHAARTPARRTRPLYLAIFSRNCSPDFFFVTKEKKEKKTSPTQKKNETILAA